MKKILSIILLLTGFTFGQELLLYDDENYLQDIINSLSTLDQPIVRIGLYGNSIIGGGSDEYGGMTTGTYPPKMYYKNLQRVMLDSLPFTKPIFRSMSHADWVKNGTWTSYSAIVTPSLSIGSNYYEPSTNSATAKIQVSGKTRIEFLFESIGLTMYATTNSGVITGGNAGTGVGVVDVSTNGGTDWVRPSALLTDLNGGGALDTIDTFFSTVSAWDTNDPQANPYYLVGYALDSGVTYDFRITWDSTYTGRVGYPLRLWGCYYWSGNTVMVYNAGDPGMDWDVLESRSYGRIYVNDYDLVLVESPYYHNSIYPNGSITLTSATSGFLERMKDYKTLTGTNFVIMSCPPGGIHPRGLFAATSWAYYPGINIMLASGSDGTGGTGTLTSRFEYWNIFTKGLTNNHGLGWMDVYQDFKDYVESLGDSIPSTGWVVPQDSIFYTANKFDTLGRKFAETFESGISQWGTLGGAKNVPVLTTKHFGTYSDSVKCLATDDGVRNNLIPYTTITDSVYKVTFWIKPSNTSIKYRIRAGTGASDAVPTTTITGLNAGIWNAVSFEYTETAGGTGAYMFLYSTEASTFYLDDVRVIEKVNGVYFDSIYVNQMTKFVSYLDGHHYTKYQGYLKWYEFINDALLSKVIWHP